ncbi:MAG TPA: prolyl oligopeptidase family serine peptidase [Nocardioidaceae bacterium]|nr:prolyl oligopeptidase family serine peptidase [Nocardioidaceae bacterium]
MTEGKADPATESTAETDPYRWLEEVEGDRQLDWARARSKEAETELAAAEDFAELERGIREVLDSDARIPIPSQVGDHIYNFWRDADNERGLWRRTTPDGYRLDNPPWETVLDLDALGSAEGQPWVWHGAQLLRPDYRLALVDLSRGGSDADVTREFDVQTLEWVSDGFERPESKGGLGWVDRDAVFVSTDFGPGSMTDSGYPRLVKLWRRGTPLADASQVYAGEASDVVVAGQHDDSPGFERDFVLREIAFYRGELYVRAADGALTKVDAPDSAEKSVHRRWLTLLLRDPWTVAETPYPAGALLVVEFDGFLHGERRLALAFEPSEHSSLEAFAWTKHHLVLTILEDVKTRLEVLTPSGDGWRRTQLTSEAAIASLDVRAVDSDETDTVWLTAHDFLQPPTLSVADVSGDQPAATAPERVKAMPALFDGRSHVAEQHFAKSDDGTRVPYFLIRPRDLALDGTAPTLLRGYGGFEVSEMPAYDPVTGKGWVEPGGVYAVANIRGGGEYGPRWHQAALRENRHRAYEDFAAVARDLCDRGVTSPAHLGCMGGSNGGLLVGNMLTRWPRLFGAIVVAVPLLDMRRYSRLLAGASWMAEYGDPDTDDWEFIRTFSPYHLFDAEVDYPPTLIWTTTRDDRVHPGHARKMAALMSAAGKDVRYFENTEGGHGAGSTNAQVAHLYALTFAFLRKYLGDPAGQSATP